MNISFMGNDPQAAAIEAARQKAAAEAAAKAAQRGAGDAMYAKVKAENPSISETEASAIATQAATTAYNRTLKTAMSRIQPVEKPTSVLVPTLLAVGAAYLLAKG